MLELLAIATRILLIGRIALGITVRAAITGAASPVGRAVDGSRR